jgi:hypothetical protein
VPNTEEFPPEPPGNSVSDSRAKQSASEPPVGNPPGPDIFPWRSRYGGGQIHLPGFMFCVAGVVFLTKLSSLLSPFNLYFTFSELISSSPTSWYNPLSFIIKAVIPLLVGAIYFTVHRYLVGFLHTEKPIELRDVNLELTAQAGTGFGALLLAWPALMLWEFVVSESVLPLRIQFVLVYVLYVVSFSYLGSVGVVLARLVWAQGLSDPEIRQKLKLNYELIVAGRSLVVALLTGGFADWVSKRLIS